MGLVMRIILAEKTKEAIIDAFAKALDFPAYYSRNWDSFEEIISDMIGEGRFPRSLEIVVGKINRDIVTCLQILADQGLIGSGELRFASHSTEAASPPH